ncbi:hypothetical protein R1sor_001831 [Riccia sorocarpa]|uniref:C2 domain-containing protein n=1 Tax=Riccia sorocarpa TaxID=122646 RepID=A0ABD3H2Z7_9MARC
MAKGGTLQVTLVSATLSPHSPAQDSSDSYATLTCGKQQFTTKIAQDQGRLPTWNERHSFAIEDSGEFEFKEVIIEIFAARPELNELLGTARLPFSKVVPANEETSLYSLSLPNIGGERGQVKVTLKWEPQIAPTESPLGPVYSVYGPTAPMYPPATAQPSAPPESYYVEQLYADASSPADAAASALAGLVLKKEEPSQTSHEDKLVSASDVSYHQPEAPLPYSPYPSVPGKRPNHPQQPPAIDTCSINDSYLSYSSDTPGTSPTQGLPYLASPIGGVVTSGPNYNNPPQSYTHPPSYEFTSRVRGSDSVAQRNGVPSNAYLESSHGYLSSPATYPPRSVDRQTAEREEKADDYQRSRSEGYPPAFQASETLAEEHSYSGYKPWSRISEKCPPAAPSYSDPSVGWIQNPPFKSTTSSPPYSAAPSAEVHAPARSFGYPSESSFPSSSHYGNGTPLPAAPEKEETNFSVSTSSQGTSQGSAQERDKGFHEYGYANPSEGYGQPYYPSVAYQPYGYPQNIPLGYPPAGYPPQYAAPHYVPPGLGVHYPPHGHHLSYGVPLASHAHPQQHGHYGGHEGHYGEAKFEGHNGVHGYWQQGYSGQHSGGHGYGGYEHGNYSHHGGHH